MMALPLNIFPTLETFCEEKYNRILKYSLVTCFVEVKTLVVFSCFLNRLWANIHNSLHKMHVYLQK